MSKTAEDMKFYYRIIRTSLRLQNYMNQCNFSRSIKTRILTWYVTFLAMPTSVHYKQPGRKMAWCTHKHVYITTVTKKYNCHR